MHGILCIQSIYCGLRKDDPLSNLRFIRPWQWRGNQAEKAWNKLAMIIFTASCHKLHKMTRVSKLIRKPFCLSIDQKLRKCCYSDALVEYRACSDNCSADRGQLESQDWLGKQLFSFFWILVATNVECVQEYRCTIRYFLRVDNIFMSARVSLRTDNHSR